MNQYTRIELGTLPSSILNETHYSTNLLERYVRLDRQFHVFVLEGIMSMYALSCRISANLGLPMDSAHACMMPSKTAT